MRDTIAAQMRDAMKAGQKVRVGALRLIMAALKEREIEARAPQDRSAGPMNSPLLTKMVKRARRRRALSRGGTGELAEQESAEIAVINEFLPKQMDESRVTAAAEAAIASHRRRRHARHGQGRHSSPRSAIRSDGFHQGQRGREGVAQ